ncbi:hypothetical protein LX36DRAFT_197705 [Colletotrichum falcatum]|nr:hypothetical protein LX36DRAFT_197705 [Colletotrichum falcatum]
MSRHETSLAVNGAGGITLAHRRTQGRQPLPRATCRCRCKCRSGCNLDFLLPRSREKSGLETQKTLLLVPKSMVLDGRGRVYLTRPGRVREPRLLPEFLLAPSTPSQLEASGPQTAKRSKGHARVDMRHPPSTIERGEGRGGCVSPRTSAWRNSASAIVIGCRVIEPGDSCF